MPAELGHLHERESDAVVLARPEQYETVHHDTKESITVELRVLIHIPLHGGGPKTWSQNLEAEAWEVGSDLPNPGIAEETLAANGNVAQHTVPSSDLHAGANSGRDRANVANRAAGDLRGFLDEVRGVGDVYGSGPERVVIATANKLLMLQYIRAHPQRNVPRGFD